MEEKTVCKVVGNYRKTYKVFFCEKLGITKHTRYHSMRLAKQDELKMIIGDLRRLQEPQNGMKPIQFRLKKYVHYHITSLIRSNSYKGLRHSLSLPVRGQRTRTNYRTSRRLNKGRTTI